MKRSIANHGIINHQFSLLFEIVWDDRQRDAMQLIAAFRAVGPQATIWQTGVAPVR
jgi:hypothetical protein